MIVFLRRASFSALLLAIVVAPFLLVGDLLDGVARADLSGGTRGTIALVVALLLAADIFAPVPSSLVCLAAGSLLGVAAGTAVAAVGLTLGCLAGLLLVRGAGPPVVRRLLSEPDQARLEAVLRRYGVLVLVVCRPVPVFAEVSVLAAGTARMPLARALSASAAANVGVAAAYAALGAAAGAWWEFLVVVAASWLLPGLALLTAQRGRRCRDRILSLKVSATDT